VLVLLCVLAVEERGTARRRFDLGEMFEANERATSASSS